MQRALALHSIFWPKENTILKQTLLVLLGTIVLSLAAQISIPLHLVPLTFESVTVIFAGGVCYLANLLGWHLVMLFGVMPFIILEPLKLMALSLIAPKFWK